MTSYHANNNNDDTLSGWLANNASDVMARADAIAVDNNDVITANSILTTAQINDSAATLTALVDDNLTAMTFNLSSNATLILEPTDAMSLTFITVCGIWITGLCCLLGIAGNALSFVVLVRAFGKSPMFFVLRAVAVSDAVFLTCVFIIQTLVNLHPHTGLFKLCNDYRGYIQYSVWPILMITQMSTVWLTILVSVERYIAICFPLKSAYLLSLSHIKRAVTIVFLVSVLYNVPRFFEHRIVEPAEMQKSAIVDNAFYRYIYMSTLYALTLFLVPLALLIILNAKLVCALQRGKKQWANLASRQRKEQTLTIIPLTIVCVFFICGTPSSVVNIIESVHPNINSHQNANYIRLLVVANLLVVLNSACNFIIYCMLGKRFRTQLIELCRCAVNRQSKQHRYEAVHKLVTSKSSDI